MLVFNELPVLSGVRVRKHTHTHTKSTTMSALSWRGRWKECTRGVNCRGFLWYRRWVIGPPQICSYLSQFQSLIHHHYGHYCISPQASCWQKSRLRHWGSEVSCDTSTLVFCFWESRSERHGWSMNTTGKDTREAEWGISVASSDISLFFVIH